MKNKTVEKMGFLFGTIICVAFLLTMELLLTYVVVCTMAYCFSISQPTILNTLGIWIAVVFIQLIISGGVKDALRSKKQ